MEPVLMIRMPPVAYCLRFARSGGLRRCPIKLLGQRSRKRNFTRINRKKIRSCGEKPWLEISECLDRLAVVSGRRFGRRGL